MKAQLQSLSNIANRRHETLISWIPPPDDWLKVNTDGSVIHPHSLAAAGGIIRDFQGRAIDGFSANLGACSIMRAELLAAEIGLSRAWDLGAKKVILEFDSLAAVLSIQEPSEWDTRHGPTLRQIQLLQSRDWQVVVQHCYREANRAADLLAHAGHSSPLGTHPIVSWPSNIRSACFSDCTGVSHPRTIPL
ncbi:Putative ribonuclease H protein At1g65750 [Linum perenne]